MKLFTFLTAFILSIVLISCGDDNPTNPGNNGNNETLIYSRDTFNLETTQTGNFYESSDFFAIFDSSNSVKVTFTIAHNLDSTNSQGVFVWNFYGIDSISTSKMRGNHTLNLSNQQVFTSVRFFNVIYFSNSTLLKYIRVKDIKIYQIN